MTILEKINNSLPDFPNNAGFLERMLMLFNSFTTWILSIGHVILFFVYFLMGIYLFHASKKIRYTAKMQGINEAYLKKNGATSSYILVLCSYGFLTGILTNAILWLFSSLPSPVILTIIKRDYLYYRINSLSRLKEFSLLEQSLYLSVCTASFIGFILFSIGIYYMGFGDSVLKSKRKSSGFIIVGIVLLIMCGLTPCLRLFYKM